MQDEDEAEDVDAHSDSAGGSGFVVPDDHLSGDEGINNDQRDLDGLQADLHGELPDDCTQRSPSCSMRKMMHSWRPWFGAGCMSRGLHC